jgi:hypothetical protein
MKMNHNFEAPAKVPENEGVEKVEKAERGIRELVDLSSEVIDAINSAEQDFISTGPTQEKAIKAKTLSERYQAATKAYLRSIVLGGLILTASESGGSSKPETFNESVVRAKLELQTRGITSEQEKAYKPLINSAIYQGIYPYGYEGSDKTIEEVVKNIIQRREVQLPNAEDAWRLYLGLPQEHNTFDISEYRPSKEKGDQKYYYKINGHFDKITHRNPSEIKLLVERLKNPKPARVYGLGYDRWYAEKWDTLPIHKDEMMGRYTLSQGEDERGHYISYWDRWDLDIGIEKDGFFGRPFEIYDRMYYDPVTFEPMGDVGKHLTE